MDARFKSEYRWGKRGELIVDHADIFWTNFRGEEKVSKTTGKTVNMKGQRNFNVYIYNTELAEEMRDAGWNVKIVPPRNEGDEPSYCLSVELRWRDKMGELLNEGLLPKVHLEGTNGEEDLSEKTVGILDEAEISDVGIYIRPRHYDGNNGHAIKAFLDEGWFVVEESNRGEMYRKSASNQKENDTANGKFEWEVSVEDRVIDILEDLEKKLDDMNFAGTSDEPEYGDICDAINLLSGIYGLHKN